MMITEQTGRKEGYMRKRVGFFIIAVMALLLSGCVHCTSDMRVGEIKAGLSCVTYRGDLGWKQVAEMLGEPDCFPRPEPGSQLTANTRVYQRALVLFSTGLKEVQEGDKTRFVEAVTGLEVCRQR
jgi:hypothetical protein